jgi:diguanylate cyclase (GGDEF)-like protein
VHSSHGGLAHGLSRIPLAAIVLVAGATLSLLGWHLVDQQVEREARGRFETLVAEARAQLQARMQSYYGILNGLRGLFQADPDLDRAAFHRYIASLGTATNFSEIRAISFVRRVPQGEKAAFEARMRRDARLAPPGDTAFGIRPAGERAEYLVVTYVDPPEATAAIGLDIAADPQRAVSTAIARDSGGVTATGKTVMPSVPVPSESAVSLRLAVYRDEAPLTVADRRRAFTGFVALTFLVREMMSDVVWKVPSRPLEMRVIDAGPRAGEAAAPDSEDNLLYRTGAVAGGRGALRDTVLLEAGDRQWQVRFRAPRRHFIGARDEMLPWIALAGGLVISALLAGLIHALAGTGRRATELAGRMTEDLRSTMADRERAEKRRQMEHAVTRVLAEADTLASAVPRIIQTICDAMGWHCGARWKWDKDTGLLRCRDCWGIDAPEIQEYLATCLEHRLKPEGGRKGLVRQAFTTGKPVSIADITSEASFERMGAAARAGLHGGFAFPLLLGNEVHGVMEFFHRDVRAPDETLEQIAQSIGSQIGQYIVRKQAEEAVQFVATHDALTSLPNRVLFNQSLDRALALARRHGRRLAVLFIDLDRFKLINDTLGHDAGDTLLTEVARRLTGSLRASDTVARLGGDEFVVLIEEIPDPAYLIDVAQKLIQALGEPLTLAGHEYRMTASIGISSFPDDAQDMQGLLKNADIAMYRAKEQGRNNFQFYSARMNVHSVERLSMETGLRRALEREELVLHYQPKIDLRSGAVTGVEALVRWQHPELGLVPPVKFIGIAEETGLIVPIGQWVLREACRAHRAWGEAGLPHLRMAVNLSARQLLHADLVQETGRVLERTGCEPGCLEFEITESMVMQNPARAVELIRELKGLGIAISIDDFGTGYSSLAYLKRFPIDSLKIDRSFIHDLPRDAGNMAITQAVIGMAHSLKLTVIAEGVETREQLDFLRGHDCDEMQGFYFSKPVPAEGIAALLAQPAAGAVAASAGN